MPSLLTVATAAVSNIKGEDGFIRTEQFLAVCRLVLPVIGDTDRSAPKLLMHSW